MWVVGEWSVWSVVSGCWGGISGFMSVPGGGSARDWMSISGDVVFSELSKSVMFGFDRC